MELIFVKTDIKDLGDLTRSISLTLLSQLY